MSHLQPRFIAKAKAAHKRSGVIRQLPRSMLVDQATMLSIATRRDPDCPWNGHWSFHLSPDYRIFTLKKGK